MALILDYTIHLTTILYSFQLLEIPSSLKETIYDVTTPKSDKVKRNLSDRVVTPGRGGKKEVFRFIVYCRMDVKIA